MFSCIPCGAGALGVDPRLTFPSLRACSVRLSVGRKAWQGRTPVMFKVTLTDGGQNENGEENFPADGHGAVDGVLGESIGTNFEERMTSQSTSISMLRRIMQKC